MLTPASTRWLRNYAFLSVYAVILSAVAGVVAQSVIEGRVGSNYSSDGTNPVARQDRWSSLCLQQSGGKYSEAVYRGNVFSGTTAATGVSTASLTVTTTGQITLANPIGSARIARVMRGDMAYVSGTFGAGSLVWAVNSNPNAAAVTGTAITAKNMYVGTAGTPACALLTTSTLPAAPTPVRNFCSLGASLASTANVPWIISDDVDGAIILAPGSAVTLTGTTAAGTSPLVTFSITWEELIP